MKAPWFKEHLAGAKSALPFSFTYDGQPSAKWLAEWPVKVADERLDANRIRHTLTWADPKTGLEVRCVAVDYADFPAVEWTVWLKNTGTNNTPILENIQGLDARFARGAGGEFILNGIKGDWTDEASFQPYELNLGPNFVKRFAPSQHPGKSTSGPDGWPYFNLLLPDGRLLIAVGWPGQWAASFTRDGADALRIVAGQELTHLRLKPGEEIRTPLTAFLFSDDKELAGSQNLWRRWYLAHVIPRNNGQPQQPVSQIQVDGSEADIPRVQEFLDAGIRPDICWRDAGSYSGTWYPSKMEPWKGDLEWLNTGTWEVDPTKFPNGFRPFSDWVHERGMKFLLWFEPERVGSMETWLGRNHPAWIMPCNAQGRLLNLGDPAALEWLINHIDGLIKSQRIDWYREDMNGEGPMPGWRGNDAPDRQGITENLYVQGHLKFWDELKRRNPGLGIDSCASGGRRNDLESMRRAVLFARSDFQMLGMKNVVDGNQCHTYGLSYWFPFQGSACRWYDPYSFRTFYMGMFGMCEWLNPGNKAAQVQAYSEWSKVAPFMVNGDYYPLTGYSLADTVWIGWQFDWPAKGQGCVQAFRRKNNGEAAQTYRLRGLDPAAVYEVTNFDVAGSTKVSGKELMEKGLTVEIKDKPGAAVIVYRRVQPEK